MTIPIADANSTFTMTWFKGKIIKKLSSERDILYS